MKKRSDTANRILDAGRKIFNRKGYVATSVAEIAASLGMSQGNLTYHFPTKRDLAMAIEDDLLALMKESRGVRKQGTIADDYIRHVIFGMEVTWRYRFLMRDRMHYAGGPIGRRPDSELTAGYDEMMELLGRIEDENLIEWHGDQTIDDLARTLWIVSRFWVDYLRELEGMEEIDWADRERGIRHHMAVLLPFLTDDARENFNKVLDQHMDQERLTARL